MPGAGLYQHRTRVVTSSSTVPRVVTLAPPRAVIAGVAAVAAGGQRAAGRGGLGD